MLFKYVCYEPCHPHTYTVCCVSLQLQLPLWLDKEQVEETYDRSRALKQLFFDVFEGAKTNKLHISTFVSV